MSGGVEMVQAAPESGGIPIPDLSGATILLDFDGTLVDLAPTPHGIELPEELPGLLSDLGSATGGRTIIVTGRTITDIEKFLPGFQGTVLACHGAERRVAGEVVPHLLSGSDTVRDLFASVAKFARSESGLLEEWKPTGAVLHFRQVPEAAERVREFMAGLAAQNEGFELHSSKLAYELRPDDIGKDSAIRALMAEPPYEGTRPAFFGDDLTDEPALELVHAMGGISVRVGPGETAAPYYLPDPAATRALLRSWLARS